MFPEQIFHLHNFLINFRSRIIENVNDRKKIVGPKTPHCRYCISTKSESILTSKTLTGSRKAFQLISKEKVKEIKNGSLNREL